MEDKKIEKLVDDFSYSVKEIKSSYSDNDLIKFVIAERVVRLLTNHKQSILKLVDDMISKEDEWVKYYNVGGLKQSQTFHQGRYNLLTELKGKIEAL